MIRILDIALKDLAQILRDRKSFLFLLIMPVLFTFMFGFAFGGFSSSVPDPRLPIAVINADGDFLSLRLVELLNTSQVVALTEEPEATLTDYTRLLIKGDIVALLEIPSDYSSSLLAGDLPQLSLTTDTTQQSGLAVETEILTLASRLAYAAQTARIVAATTSNYTAAFETALSAWSAPPFNVVNTTAQPASPQVNDQIATLAHTSPGMILQFAIASLLTSATIIVNERKTRSLQRLLTTPARRVHILLGHYLAIFLLTFAQFLVLILFGQLVLNIDYFRLPTAILLVAFTSSLCIAALGLLIGVLAKSEEQAIAFSLIPMFLLSGLGGAWVPLEFTGAAFQAIGHFSPVAWAMDGFKNITVRLLSFDSVLLPSAALLGYALLFSLLAVWRFRRVSE